MFKLPLHFPSLFKLLRSLAQDLNSYHFYLPFFLLSLMLWVLIPFWVVCLTIILVNALLALALPIPRTLLRTFLALIKEGWAGKPASNAMFTMRQEIADEREDWARQRAIKQIRASLERDLPLAPLPDPDGPSSPSSRPRL